MEIFLGTSVFSELIVSPLGSMEFLIYPFGRSKAKSEQRAMPFQAVSVASPFDDCLEERGSMCVE